MALTEQIALSILRRLNPEDANNMALRTLQARSCLPGSRKNPIEGQEKNLMGLRFVNPCGIAAGLDKNGDCINGLVSLGTGFIELGTVTPLPQQGNKGKRIIRLPEEEALINRLGFNNKGVSYLLERLKDFRRNSPYIKHPRTIIGVNIGKGALTPLENAADDYISSMQLIYTLADYITINISSPNTPGLRQLQHKEELSFLLDKIKSTDHKLQQIHNKKCPLILKLSPDLNEKQIRDIADIINKFEISGVIATNTSTEHPWRDKMEGGISGKPLAAPSLKVLKAIHSELGKKITIIAAGGIDSRQEVQKRMDAGADLIQLYTALIYKGSELINDLVV